MPGEAPTTTRQVAEAVLVDSHHRTKLLTYAQSRFGIGREDAEDLVQDTALDLLRHQSYVQSPQGFVFAVFRSRCGKFLEGRRTRAETAGTPQISESIPHPVGTERLDLQVSLRQALREISSSCRRLLSAYYIEGRSLSEAARENTLAFSGASKTINRCLQRLRRCLN